MNNDILAELVEAPTYPTPQTDDKSYRRLGLFILFMLIGVFGVWAAYAPLDSAIATSGKVVVASNNRTIQHMEGGIIKSIHVRDGQNVQKGDTLMVLDATQVESQSKVLEASYFHALALEARLIAERGNDSSILFSSEFNTFPGTSYRTEMENQHREFTVRRSALENDTLIFNQRIAQAEQQINGLSATLKSKTALLKTYNDEVKELEVLYKQQLIDKIRLRDAKRQVFMTQSELEVAQSDISRMQSQISETRAQIVSTKEKFQQELLSRLSETQAQISDIRARMTGMRDLMAHTKITTPVNGTVVNLGIHTIGGVVVAGKPIMDIVPTNEPLIVEVKIIASDITNAHVGMEADVQFPSFAHVKTLKEVKGEVMSIGADAIDDQKQELHYIAQVRITPEGMKELYRNKLTIQPGIPASVMIIVAKRTFADYLIHPFKEMLRKSFNEQ